MNQQLSDRRDIEFVLFDQIGAHQIANQHLYTDFSRKTMELILAEARGLAQKEIVPTNVDGDREGCVLEADGVTVPKSFHRAWELLKEGGWITMTESTEWEGQGMPKSLATAATEILAAANNSLYLYAALTKGAASLVDSFGTDRQKEQYLRKMNTGHWTGTMLLTEPNSGSDLGTIETSAVKQPDGTYAISGEKIFISGGDHDLSENIIHPVLARIEGAPDGSKGISLFLVPKYRITADGSPGEFNNVACTSLEHKMGIHGNATCALSLGAKGETIGELLGTENKGLREMFQMMNEERVFVGLQGLSLAASSYANSVKYAKERIQGKDITGRLDSTDSVPIIHHPDVRRQLCLMKAYVEGARSLLYYAANVDDQKNVTEEESERKKLTWISEFLTPIIKAYITDSAFNVCSWGVQIFGGYGYTEEFPQSQLLRDCRITMIYEGTNGIQAIDFLSRKVFAHDSTVFNILLGEIQNLVNQATEIAPLRNMAILLNDTCERARQLKKWLEHQMKQDEAGTVYLHAYPFMEIMGDLLMGWMLLWRSRVAHQKLKNPGKEKEFFEGQILSADFFIHSTAPITAGKVESILKLNSAPMEMHLKAF